MDFYPVAESYMTSHEFRIGLTELSTTVIDFAAELKSQGRRLVIVYAPSKEETYADKLKAVGVPPLEFCNSTTRSANCASGME